MCGDHVIFIKQPAHKEIQVREREKGGVAMVTLSDQTYLAVFKYRNKKLYKSLL